MDINIDVDFPISKETIGKIFEPTLVPLSKALGGIIQWVFQKPIEYGVVKPLELEYLKSKTQERLNLIPENNRTSNNLGLTLKAFEDSRYQLKSKTMADYFSKLIAGTVDNRVEVKPIFSTILADMTEDDAKLFEYFYSKDHLFENQISHSNPAFKDERYRYYSPKNYYLITGDFVTGQYRGDPQIWNDALSKNIVKLDVEDSLLFLKSKELIINDITQNSHVLLSVVEQKSLDTDEWLQQILADYSDNIYNRITKQTTNVYSLSHLGHSLAEIICRTD